MKDYKDKYTGYPLIRIKGVCDEAPELNVVGHPKDPRTSWSRRHCVEELKIANILVKIVIKKFEKMPFLAKIR